MTRLALIRHFEAGSVLAYHNGAAIRVERFLHEVVELARLLPQKSCVLNACTDRYRFCVALAAALVRGQVTLLPPNQTQDMLERLRSRYADLYVLTDARDQDTSRLPTLRFPDFAAGAGGSVEVPTIPASQAAVLMFTSGSTGEPVPHEKSWGTLVESGSAEAGRLGLARGTVVLGTVPPQHMYGLESTVLMPLQAGCAIHGGRPFYPADICDALESLPRPRAIVTTPVHLRTLVAETLTVPAVDLIVCATAPLTPQLAAEAEARFRSALYEIYGCTEAGQVASRRTVEAAEWQPLPGMRLSQDERGTWVRGGHVHEAVLLSDLIELRGR